MSEVVLKASGLTKRFHEGLINLTVLHGVDLQVHAGETLAIVGSSGSGKSTLLHLMGGLDAPTSGQVELKGQLMSSLSPQQQGDLRFFQLDLLNQTRQARDVSQNGDRGDDPSQAASRVLFAERQAGHQGVLRFIAFALGHGAVGADDASFFQLLFLRGAAQARGTVHNPEAATLLRNQLDQWHGRFRQLIGVAHRVALGVFCQSQSGHGRLASNQARVCALCTQGACRAGHHRAAFTQFG